MLRELRLSRPARVFGSYLRCKVTHGGESFHAAKKQGYICTAHISHFIIHSLILGDTVSRAENVMALVV